MNVIIIGAYPPPTGGNSVHIKRLEEALILKGNNCTIIDLYGEANKNTQASNVYRVGPAGLKSLLKCILITRKKTHEIVHFHVSAMERFLYAGYALMKFSPANSKKIITIHSGQFVDTFKSLSHVKQKILGKLLNQFSHVIVVNNGQKRLLETIGIPPRNISVIPAYIPPNPKPFLEAEQILGDLYVDGRVLLVSSGYGEPLYGYHHIIEAIKRTPTLNNRVSLLLCLYNQFDKKYMEQLNTSIHELESVKVVYDLDAEQFAYILSKGQVYIRATDTDGDAVAIREAAHFGLTVIASNVVERPNYCRLFNISNLDGLINKLTQCIDVPLEGATTNEEMESTAGKILNIYQQKNKTLT